jgi:hypothetical protein
MLPSEIFEQVLLRPSLYTSAGNSVGAIAAFMSGFIQSQECSSLNFDADIYFGFQKWVEARYELDPSRQWQHIIIYMSPSEEQALRLTRELWQEYKAEKTSQS